MHKVFLIALNGLTRTARDKKVLALLLLMPLILIAILGSALKGAMTAGKINPFDVVLLNEDQPVTPKLPPGAPPVTLHFGMILAEEVLGSDRAGEVLNLRTAASLDEAKAAVAAGKARVAVYIPSTFTQDALDMKRPAVQLFSDPGHPTQAEIVNQIVQSFTEQLTARMLIDRHLPPGELQQGVAAALPKVVTATPGSKEVSAMQYYAAAMAVMFMVMTALARAKDLIQEREDGTLFRLLMTPTSRSAILAGQILGSVALLMGQFLIMMVGTRLIYGVDWGPTLPVLALGLAFSVATTGLGALATSVLKDPGAADAAVGLVGPLFGALSGAMMPLYFFPDALRMVARAIPNYWALQGFLDQMSGAGNLGLPVTVLVLMGLATGAFGTWRLAAK